MRRYTMVLGLVALLPLLALAAVPFWGDRQSRPVDTAAADLKPGQWVWLGDDKSAGPMAVIVSLTEQRAYVYRNGILMAWTTVSTGKAGYETPTGVFTILQKDKDHRSNKYNSAPMPYQQRLTWDGVALHAGGLPGYPESHGCVHLPTGFAQKLFDASTMGMVVVVAKAGHSAADLVHPGALSPIDPSTGKDVDMPLLEDGQPWRWDPSRAGKGPLSVVLSRTDRILFVYRDGVEIGRTRIKLDGEDTRSGTHAYVVKAGYAPPVAGSVTPTTPMPEWIGIGVPGSEDDAGAPVPEDLLRQVVIPEAFKAQVLPLVQPGTVLVATDAHVLPQTTGVHLQVIDADPPEQ